MSRGRKKAKSSGLDWQGLFHKSQGVYFQFILSELGKKADFTITDETGAELLEKIRAEKDNLLKEKKIKQGKLQDAEVQSELVFEIPKNWVWCKLDDICLNITDGTHQTPKYTESGRPFISAQHVKPFRFSPDNYKFVSEEAYQECIKNGQPEIGDILITRVGAIGEAAVIDTDLEFAYYVSVGLIKPFKEYLHPKFLEYVINSPYGNLYSKGNVSSKGSSAGNFNLGRIRSFLIPLPPIIEQKNIIDFLQDFGNQSLIEGKEYFDSETEKKVIELHESQLVGNQLSAELTHQLDLVKQLRQAFLREAMQGKLVEPSKEGETGQQLLAKIKAEKAQLIAAKKLKKEKDLPPIKPEEIPGAAFRFEIPEHWTWCRLGEVAEEVVYGTSEKAFEEGEVPVLRMGNITTDGKILYSNLKYVSSEINDLPKLYLKNGDMVFNRTNSFELVGKTGVFEKNESFTLASYLIRVRFLTGISSKFISNYINSSLCRATQLEPQIIQQNGQANFNGTKLGNIIIPLPPLSEQQRIVEKLESLMQTCDALEESIKAGQRQNEQLLQQVLREALKK